MDSQKKIHKYFYILGYGRDGVYLDSFYKVQSKADTLEESQLMQAIGDDTEARAIYRDRRALQSLDYRARFANNKLQVMFCLESVTRDQFEKFLMIEHEHIPKSRWLK